MEPGLLALALLAQMTHRLAIATTAGSSDFSSEEDEDSSDEDESVLAATACRSRSRGVAKGRGGGGGGPQEGGVGRVEKRRERVGGRMGGRERR